MKLHFVFHQILGSNFTFVYTFNLYYCRVIMLLSTLSGFTGRVYRFGDSCSNFCQCNTWCRSSGCVKSVSDQYKWVKFIFAKKKFPLYIWDWMRVFINLGCFQSHNVLLTCVNTHFIDSVCSCKPALKMIILSQEAHTCRVWKTSFQYFSRNIVSVDKGNQKWKFAERFR